MTPPRAAAAESLPRVVTTPAELRTSVEQARHERKSIGLVPTMGALHEGHLSLVDASRRQCGYTVVTIFVNPTQFGPQEDYRQYPRTLQADVAALGPRGADLVFAPPVESMYRPGHATHVEPSGVALPLEGQRRPGHFRGVATIVLKLFNLVVPDVAYFGQKDYQQWLVIKQMAADLDLPLKLQACPIVRDADGLAMSSRNAYLDARQRQQALVLSRALRAASELYHSGQRNAAAIRQAMLDQFATEADVQLDYAVVADAETLAEPAYLQRPAVALVAAFVGPTRLIDNVLLAAEQSP